MRKICPRNMTENTILSKNHWLGKKAQKEEVDSV